MPVCLCTSERCCRVHLHLLGVRCQKAALGLSVTVSYAEVTSGTVAALSGSDDDDLDDAEATTAAIAREQAQDITETEILQEALLGAENGFRGFMGLTQWQLIKWRYGWRPDAHTMAARTMACVDLNKNGNVGAGTLDVLVRFLDGDFSINKVTLDVVEVRAPATHLCQLLHPPPLVFLCKFVKSNVG